MKNFIKEFKEFAVKGNVVDLAIGIIIGSAFNGIVNSLVKDVVMPPIGLALKRVDFSNLFVTLGSGEYNTIAEAQAAGAPTINYGIFINTLISFLITAFVVFLIVKWINRLKRKHEAGEEIPATTKQCPFCFSMIDIKATRCSHCTSTIS